MLKYWNYLVSLNRDGILKHLFLHDVRGRNNWSSEIKSIFTCLNMTDHTSTVTPCDVELATRRVECFMNDSWLLEIQNKPKLRTYVLFKSKFGAEDYVSMHLTKYQRSLFAQLRCGVLPLQVEVGRFSNTPLEMRICKLCGLACEDEVHFVCDCSVYNEERQDMFKDICMEDPSFRTKNSIEKFIHLMVNCQLKLAKFVSMIWGKRRNVIFHQPNS